MRVPRAGGISGAYREWSWFGLEHSRGRVHFLGMKDEWNESLRCPICGRTGKASLSQDDDDAPTIQMVPGGFKIVDTEHGPDFFCLTCDVAVKP